MTTPDITYFDWAGASLMRKSVAAALQAPVPEICFNPEAVHPAGKAAGKLLTESAARLSYAVAGNEFPAIWAASGSDLFRLAANAAAEYARRKNTLITTFEHPAAIAAWQNFPGGCKICQPVELAEYANENTGFVILSHIQSVLGWILPVEKIIEDVRQRAPQALIFVDTIQSAAKYKLPAGGDFYSVSAAKLGSPAGGAAWLAVSARSRKLLPIFKALRNRYYISGRPEPLQATLMALAAEEQQRNRDAEYENVKTLNTFVRTALDMWRAPNGETIHATIPAEEASAWILHLHCHGYQSAVLLRMLAKEKICLSAGSACQAETDKPDSAMIGWGFKKADAFSGLRISFGFSSNLPETQAFVKKFKEILHFY